MPKLAKRVKAPVIDQEYMVVLIDSIRPHPENPNKGDVGMIEESIEHNDWYGACIVQKSTGYILAGEHRWRAAKAKGMTEVPVIVRDVDDAKALRIMLVDNESARRATIDDEQVSLILETLADIGEEELAGSGYALPKALEVGADDEGEIAGDLGDDEAPFDPDDVEEPPLMWGVVVTVGNEEEQKQLYEAAVKRWGNKNVRVLSV